MPSTRLPPSHSSINPYKKTFPLSRPSLSCSPSSVEALTTHKLLITSPELHYGGLLRAIFLYSRFPSVPGFAEHRLLSFFPNSLYGSCADLVRGSCGGGATYRFLETELTNAWLRCWCGLGLRLGSRLKTAVCANLLLAMMKTDTARDEDFSYEIHLCQAAKDTGLLAVRRCLTAVRRKGLRWRRVWQSA